MSSSDAASAVEPSPDDSGRPDASALQALVPRHVAIIMDGNGRWAQSRGLPRLEGHRMGMDNIHRIVPCAIELGIDVVTLYAF